MHSPFASSAVVLALSVLLAPATATAQTLGLGEAVRVATQGAPSLSAQDAAIRAAREASTGAAELPDPKLIFGVDNLPVDGPDRFSHARLHDVRKVGVMQEFPSGEARAAGDARPPSAAKSRRGSRQ